MEIGRLQILEAQHIRTKTLETWKELNEII